MASVRFELSVKGGKENDRPEFQAVMRFGNPQRKIRCRTGLYGFRDYWSDKKQTHGTKFVNPLFSAEVIEVNKKLATLKTEIETAAANTAESAINRPWLSSIVEDVLHPTKQENEQGDTPKTLIQAVNDFIEAAPTTIRHKGRPICAARLNHYKQVLKNLQGMGADGVTIETADKSFYDSFVRYMYREGYKQNTISTRVKCIKSVINSLPMAERVGCEFVEPKKCKAVMEDIDNIALDENELQALAALDLADNPYLDRVRDQFLLLAWTGCRYSDLGKLTRRYIVQEDGDYCFSLEQQKTGAKVVIPILPPIVPILEKYDYQPPKPISNQRFNDYIKEVARMAGLDDEVTTTHTQQNKGEFVPGRVETRRPKWQAVTAHTARRSFATNMYKQGFQTLAIMRITGHQTEKSFLTYIKVSESENAKMVLRQFKSQWNKR
ncbi:MAG: tyrosine-type recombinase/integrase [Muribaculaceae bacterium]|nr:tyrosine-type recombinase/integrase [Muribaculaceae bacterium]